MQVICKNCQKNFHKCPSQIKRTKNNFCSRSCAASYNNKHLDKRHGPRPQGQCQVCKTTIKSNLKYCSDECRTKNKKPINRKRVKGFRGLVPFEKYWVYGPYFHKKEKRNMIFLIPINKNDDRTTISYARYLMSLFLKRTLMSNEEVDHIDGNKSNDIIENLQILSKIANIQKAKTIDYPTTRLLVLLKCPECLVTFHRSRYNTHLLVANKKKATFCSRKCSGKFYHKKNQKDIEIRLANNVIKIYRENSHDSY